MSPFLTKQPGILGSVTPSRQVTLTTDRAAVGTIFNVFCYDSEIRTNHQSTKGLRIMLTCGAMGAGYNLKLTLLVS